MLHESLRELIVARGVEVVSDADEFRGALDDFLHEDEATVGELNLLVDAVRLGAVQRFLAVVDQGAQPAAAARDAGTTLARDRGVDDPTRSRWAVAAIGYALGKAPADVVTDLRDGGSTQPVPPPAPAPPPPPPPSPAPDPPEPKRPTTADVPLTEPIPIPVPAPVEERAVERRGRAVVASVLAVALVAAIVGGVWWWQSGDDSDPAAGDPGSSDSDADSAGPAERGPVISDDELVLQLGRTDDTRLYRVDVETGATAELTKGPQDRNPGLAPDRRSLVNLKGVDRGKIPYLVDVASGAEERLFPADGPCARADRVAWSPDGSRLAAVCVTESNASKGLYVADVTGEAPFEPVLVGGPDAKGSVTWISDSAMIYQRIESRTASGLWLLDVDAGGEPERLTPSDGQFSGQPDYSAEAGLVLFLVNTDRTGPGMVWVMEPDGSQLRPLDTASVAYPVWAPDGERIAFLGGPDLDQLTVAPIDDLAGGVRVEIAEPGVPGPPVWASR